MKKAIFFICLLLLYVACTTSKIMQPENELKNTSKVLVGQYLDCDCEDFSYPRGSPSAILPARLLELYADSTFILAGNLNTDYIAGPPPSTIACFKGFYTMPTDSTIALSIKFRQMTINESWSNFVLWGDLINFGYLDEQRRALLFINPEKTQVDLYLVSGLYLGEPVWDSKFKITMNKPSHLPKPYFKENEPIDSSFYIKMTKHCRDSFPPPSQKRYK